MTIGIMQPYFMPYIGYWQLMAAVDKYVVYDDVNFIKRGWVNRNNILLNGEPYMFSIALSGASQNKLFKEIDIIDDFSKLKKTLQHSYSKAPYYEKTMLLLDEILDFPDKNLARFLYHSFSVILNYLDVQTELIMSSSVNKDNSLKGQGKILDICRVLQADRYINAIGGQELYNHDEFAQNGIELKFLQPNIVSYQQHKHEFVPNLSIIDMMMFNGKERTKKLLNEYTLV